MKRYLNTTTWLALIVLAAMGALLLATGNPGIATSAVLFGNLAAVDLSAVQAGVQKLSNAVDKRLDSFVADANGKIGELRERLQDLEQKGARKPGGVPSNTAAGIVHEITGKEEFAALMNGRLKQASFALPAGFMNMVQSDITGGTIAQPDRQSGIVAPAEQKLWLRNLLPTLPTDAGRTEFVRETSYTNNAGPQIESGSPGTTREGVTKPASELSFELETAQVITIAHTFTISRQALNDNGVLARYVEGRGIYGLKLEEEEELLTGDGTLGKLSGLISNATAYNRGASQDTKLDTIRKSITQLALANHMATGVVLNPVDAEEIELAKDGESRYIGVVVYVKGQPFVWRLPIIESNSMTAGQFLTADFSSAATIRDRQNATVEFSLDHSDYRARNLVLVLIEERIALEIHRATAMVTGALNQIA